jgi:exonuclease III
MRLITWNVARRIHCIPEQVAALRRRAADVVALQEVTTSSYLPLAKTLASIGLVHSAFSLSLSKTPRRLVGPRKFGQLIASRWPLWSMPPERFRVPWPEKVLSVLVHSPRLKFEVHAAHIPPGSSNGWTKIETFEGIFERLARKSKHPRVLCGDFNSPKEETRDGQTITWGQDLVDGRGVCWGSSQGDTGVRWDQGERGVLIGLAEFDLPDVFRTLHGFGRQEFSWYLHRKGRRIGRRFDHVFASKRLKAMRCGYLHRFREKNLSDHSPLEVDFAF